ADSLALADVLLDEAGDDELVGAALVLVTDAVAADVVGSEPPSHPASRAPHTMTTTQAPARALPFRAIPNLPTGGFPGAAHDVSWPPP
ncbi:MAG TPA: hypothetical protein P5314_16450, partial [Tetrasphaera sp.]|nr:hypothetical protein [Tetrasphaera sp.]